MLVLRPERKDIMQRNITSQKICFLDFYFNLAEFINHLGQSFEVCLCNPTQSLKAEREQNVIAKRIEFKRKPSQIKIVALHPDDVTWEILLNICLNFFICKVRVIAGLISQGLDRVSQMDANHSEQCLQHRKYYNILPGNPSSNTGK